MLQIGILEAMDCVCAPNQDFAIERGFKPKTKKSANVSIRRRVQ